MASFRSFLTNFTAGEISPRLYGRIDINKYSNAAQKIFNFVVLPHGGLRRRGGTQYINPIRGSSQYSKLVRFVFSTTQAYCLEFGPNYVRFFKDRAIITDATATITGVMLGATTHVQCSGGHSFLSGDHVILSGISGTYQLNNREFTVASYTATSFELSGIDSSSYDAWSSGGAADRIYEISTVYDDTDIADLDFTQSADTLYIFHPDWPIGLLTRTGHTAWTHEFGNVEEGPFLDINSDDGNTVSLDVASGSGIMTFTDDVLVAGHVGALFRIWEKSNSTTFGYNTWAPGASVTVADGSYWEYQGNVYQVISGGGGTLSSYAGYPTHTRGTVEVFYSTAGGSCQMRYEHSGYCVVQIDSVVDTKNANITVVKNRTPYTAYGGRSSPQWQEGAWSDKNGYPKVGTFYEQRMVAGFTSAQPSTVWGSVSGAYLNFRDGDEDDDGFVYEIAGDQVDAVLFLVSLKKLAVLTTSSEYIMSASRSDEALTPKNVKISRETSYGSAYNKPIRAGPAVLFAQRAGDNANAPRRIREFVYNFQTDSFTAPDLTLLSEHITYPGLLDGAFQATPDLVVWYPRTDGDLVGLTYERDQQVVGWHGHELGANQSGGLVKQAVTIPGADGDEVWMIVERVINSATVRYVEWMQAGLLDGDDVEDGKYLDSGLTYDGSAVTQISGLWHLEGETVSVLMDGSPKHDLTISGGRITLPSSASLVNIGYNYQSTLTTLRIEAGARAGTAQGVIGRVDEIVLRLDRTVGGKYGRDEDNLDAIPFRDPGVPISEAIALFSGDKVLPFEGDWDLDRFVTVVQDEPMPMHVLGMTVKMKVNE